MNAEDLKKIQELVERDTSYHFDAYLFVLSALSYTLKRIRERRHVSGRELLEGIRMLGLELYGRFAPEVFHHWGVHNTLDFGKIVFALVDCGILRKREEDTLDEFKDVYDFDQAFIENYEVEIKRS
ncbi:hypothetical protein DRP53_04760 [candidate division WOR-3 bacterium]|uniref:Uncharacterized protein n=1 Tax=candidate division WOR-3 bacterium TaxID=2052148 RepID=A0A660SID7_UNCW3|nr:MAG: hypothetical protein DRP53_04760 [candidate division WOR-3 bacterium]